MTSESADGRAGYLPGLDGIRAIAVGSVVAYHLQAPYFDGGLLGVSVFFTLSGYLITSLLLQSFEQAGRIDLKNFWIRRARRLLPALLLLLPVVGVTTAIARPEKLAATLRQIGCALFYFANWATIARGDDYFQRFAGPGPLDHLWSLSIEEQFYIVWPLLVLALLVVGARLARGRRVPLVLATLALTAASTWAIAHLYHPNAMNNTRAYEGTDARAASLLVGALAAMALPFQRVTVMKGRLRHVLDLAGVLGLAGVCACIARTDEYSPFLYRGGELALAIFTTALAVAAAHPETFVARALGVLPLRWIGARSYGIYLWHLPVVAFMPSTVLTGRPVLRAAVQVALMLVLAAASYRLIEEPIRRRAPVPRLRSRRSLAFRAVVMLPAATIALVVWPLSCGKPMQEDEALASEPDPAPTTVVMTVGLGVGSVLPRPGALETSCRAVAHVGDSTSLGLISKNYLPDVSDQIAARYRGVGVERFLPRISGARSMVERYRDQPNATEVVQQMQDDGYRGCWVMALGTNDPANVGGDVGALGARIDAVMAEIGQEPALWMTTRTLKDKGPYKDANMKGWNRAVLGACARHPNMRVYDWASEVRDGWFSSDDIHFTPHGYRERALRIAKALARAFPRDGESPPGCVVRSTE